MEGLTSVLAGLWGIGTGATTLTENVHTIAVTKMGSRRAVEFGACVLILMSLVGKDYELQLPRLFKSCSLCCSNLHYRLFIFISTIWSSLILLWSSHQIQANTRVCHQILVPKLMRLFQQNTCYMCKKAVIRSAQVCFLPLWTWQSRNQLYPEVLTDQTSVQSIFLLPEAIPCST